MAWTVATAGKDMPGGAASLWSLPVCLSPLLPLPPGFSSSPSTTPSATRRRHPPMHRRPHADTPPNRNRRGTPPHQCSTGRRAYPLPANPVVQCFLHLHRRRATCYTIDASIAPCRASADGHPRREAIKAHPGLHRAAPHHPLPLIPLPLQYQLAGSLESPVTSSSPPLGLGLIPLSRISPATQ